MTTGSVKMPTEAQLRAIAADLGMAFDDTQFAAHLEAFGANIAAYNIVDRRADETPAVTWPRTPGARPRAEENAHGAWYVKSVVKGAASGKLAGKTVALKDNICLAGVPMMNGAATLEGYVPDVDATVAQRILDAGGTVMGKAVCECFCFSGGSHTSATGPVHNPHRMGSSAGGSSSGSACLVALGEVDMALGGDQGGSVDMLDPGWSAPGLAGLSATARKSQLSESCATSARARWRSPRTHPVMAVDPRARRPGVWVGMARRSSRNRRGPGPRSSGARRQLCSPRRHQRA